MKRNIIYIIMCSAASVLGISCASHDDGSGNADNDISLDIKVSGVEGAGDMLNVSVGQTRATQPAEQVSWLINPLKTGLDITYYLSSNTSEKKNAVLKLSDSFDSETTPTDSVDYSFKYKNSEDNAKWLDNKGHRFEGFYVPKALYDNVNDDLMNDQSKSPLDNPSNDIDQYTNYENLTHYLCMPPNKEIMATVGYVRLPFRHRLARVKAYVLIDPALNTQIAEVDGVPQIFFENVKVIKQVKTSTVDNVTKYTPEWGVVRKARPHYLGNNFTYDTYTQVPCYDMVVRPTYSNQAYVMYDEDMSGDNTTQKYYQEKNSIDFAVKLENGLQYEKHFEFDLDANYETAVYLRITREKVDYEDTGSVLWDEYYGRDGYYGVNNGNGNRLSVAGGSWQRTYRIGSVNADITDGCSYDEDNEKEDNEKEDGQYLTQATWISHFFQAMENGDHHGDYFQLDTDIDLSSAQFPDNFVFTGHLDAKGYTITLPSNRGYLFDGLDGDYDASVGTANIHKEGEVEVPIKGYRAEVLNAKIKGKLIKDEGEKTGNVQNVKENVE